MKIQIAILSLFFVVAFAGTAAAQSVTTEVQAVNDLTVSGSPSLTIVETNSGAGSGLKSVSAAGSYAITTNGTNKRITAALSLAMPAATSLSVTFTAPTASGTSAGPVALTAAAQDVVTGITTVDEVGIPVSYTLAADVTAGILGSVTRTLTYTLTDPAI